MILVVGATGALGARVVAHLRRSDEQVRCLVRPGTGANELTALGATLVEGDLTAAQSLRDACRGVSTVVCTATVMARQLAGRGGPSIAQVDDAGVGRLIRASEDEGVRRFIYVSFAAVDQGFASPLERAKMANEKRLSASSMDTTIVRPDAFQEIHLTPTGRFDLAKGKVSVFGKGDTARRWVSTDDAAALIAAVATEDNAPALIEFGGPEAISRNELAAVAERLTGRAMKLQKMPRPIVRVALRLLDRPKPALASLFALGLHLDLVAARSDDAPLRERGIQPRSATTFLKEQAAAL